MSAWLTSPGSSTPPTYGPWWTDAFPLADLVPRHVPHPTEHSLLILPLPVEISNLQPAIQEKVGMVPSPVPNSRASKFLLEPQPGLVEVSPHHEVILEVGEDKTIIG